VSAPRAARRLLVQARIAGRRAEQSVGFGGQENHDADATTAASDRSPVSRERDAVPPRERRWLGIPRPGSTRH